MKFVFFIILIAISYLVSAADCPKYNGQNLRIIANAGGLQFYYYTNTPLSWENQRGVLILKTNGQTVAVDTQAIAGNDYYSVMLVQSKFGGFLTDSQNYSLESAWLIKNGQKEYLKVEKSVVPACTAN